MQQLKKEKMDQINREWRQMERCHEQFVKSFGLSSISFMILDELYESGENLTQKHFSQTYNLPKQTVNLVIKSFLDQGYVTLKESISDRRNKEMTLTDSGKEYIKKIYEKWDEIENDVYASTTLEEMELLHQLMIKWQTAYKKIYNK